jgi:hypothetical protein
MQSILGDAPSNNPPQQTNTAPPNQNGVTKSPDTQSQSQPSPPKFQFSLPPSQSSFGGLSQETSNGVAEKPAVNGGFKFGGSSSLTAAKEATSPAKEVVKPTGPRVALAMPKFNFEMPSTVEGKETEKPVETNPVSNFNFGSTESKDEVPTMPLFGGQVSTEPKKAITAPVFGTSGGLGVFGSAFKKSDSELTKPLFGAPPAANGSSKDAPSQSTSAAPAPTFGSGLSSAYTFGKPTPVAEPPKKQPTPPPAAPPAASQDLDDSMDITDSPPASRNPSFAGIPSDVPSQFPAFPTSAPTSAPAATPVEAPKLSFNFGTSTSQVNGTTEKPTLPRHPFNAPPAAAEEKKTAFTFGAPVANPPFGSPAPSPAPTFSGFGNAFAKKETPVETTKPVEKPYTFGSTAGPTFGATAPANPAEQKPFGTHQTTAAAAFGNTSSFFGNTSTFPSNQQPSAPVTSPPNAGNFSFNFNAPAPNASSFASGGSTFSFTPTTAAPINNPFSNPGGPPTVTSPPVSAFHGISSAPVSPQNAQLPAFPSVQSPFGAQQQQQLFGATTAPVPAINFQFGQNIPPTPIFTVGANEMQRSSSDAGPNNNVSPSGRRFAQPGSRRRLNRPR